jgi:hypothetical protein
MGVQTDQSCEGGKGLTCPFPMVRFAGSKSEGYRAVHIAMIYGYRVWELQRAWYIDDGEITGPLWKLLLH